MSVMKNHFLIFRKITANRTLSSHVNSSSSRKRIRYRSSFLLSSSTLLARRWFLTSRLTTPARTGYLRVNSVTQTWGRLWHFSPLPYDAQLLLCQIVIVRLFVCRLSDPDRRTHYTALTDQVEDCEETKRETRIGLPDRWIGPSRRPTPDILSRVAK